jgi:hypothetical protein
LPLLINPWEQKVLLQNETRTVETTIDIQASTSVVWDNIKTVPRILPDELNPSWSRRVGFPRPVEATLSHEGIGGVRYARFDGGVVFVETVDVWSPEHDLAFSIKAQTTEIPPTTLDSHVTVGGPFFDTLRGDRISTDFNWYAHLWTDAVMADIQNSILQVMRRRCELSQTGLRPS